MAAVSALSHTSPNNKAFKASLLNSGYLLCKILFFFLFLIGLVILECLAKNEVMVMLLLESVIGWSVVVRWERYFQELNLFPFFWIAIVV